MAGRVAGKVALVTGAAQGVGRAISLLLARERAAIAVADIHDEPGRSVADTIVQMGGAANFYSLDVTKEKEVEATINKVAYDFGKLDVLINCAGITGPTAPLDQYKEEDWDRVQAVNVKGAFLMTKHSIPHMRTAGAGSIINIASISSEFGLPFAPAYGASKGALRTMSRQDAAAYAYDHIRVNSVLPGWIQTPLSRDWLERVRESLKDKGTLAPFGKAEDIARAVLFFASDDSSYVTGSELYVDGGLHLTVFQ
mmetsp:Transcript_22204/g.36791  ORF Transcript_22204/g.36791 Transcript_22204/m.36791 type:complete len:254 (+) Transcript_22204:76-837(+)|eukprot:CAMPEP_0184658390 /NCGR_PEP_ID=MMETSP0308-20130426/25232_1 /TAXON_ID=38269 /ORGANISM="Gloeochaete witrockiana, Strain SAG 46.84" /LENGTH=253 /DNA_ID=CAMNT_0027097343 /DNA_START=9 /DNA_END=770 /DNA_ORIENTATION=-